MLKRLYVDNFRCLVNFEMKFDRLGLFMGENGGGKSTVFEVLKRLRSFLLGNTKVEESFPEDSPTRWQKSEKQRFDLDVEIDSQNYSYAAEINQDDFVGVMLLSEKLYVDNKPVYVFDGHEGKLFMSDGREKEYAIDSSRSIISGTVRATFAGPKIEAFRKEISKWIVLKLSPVDIPSRSDKEETSLSERGGNFASWYRYVLNEYLGNMLQLIDQLKQVMPGFDSFTLREAGESKLLKARFNTSGKSCEYNFHELSEGQRALIVLYTIVLGLRGQGYSLFLDEPDNWVSLREIQPWLRMLHDACTKDIEQAVIISHHPGIIDYLGPSMGHWFDRQENGAVRVSDKAPEDAGDLRLSEIIARGWYQ